MGRARRRQRREGNGNGNGNGHPAAPPSHTETLAPVYTPVVSEQLAALSAAYDPVVSAQPPSMATAHRPFVRERPPILAPVLELDGLDPWSEIPGPALALEQGPEVGGAVLSFDDPTQLRLEPAEAEVSTEAAARATLEQFREPDATAEAATASAQDPGAADAVSPNHGAAPAGDATVAEVAPAGAGTMTGAVAALDPIDTGLASSDGSLEAASDAALGGAGPGEAAEPVAEAPPPPPPPPDPVEILYGEARAAAEDGHCDEAERLFRQLLASHPAHVRARNNLALLLDAAGNHQAALAELDRALDIDSENSTLLVNRGALLGAMGRHAAAERDLKTVLRVEPSNAEALFNLGVVMTKKGLWAEAIPQLRRAVELEPSRGAAYYYLGESLNHVDDLAGALASYQRATELQPGNPRALYGLGIIYDRLARPDDAAHMYRRAREAGRR